MNKLFSRMRGAYQRAYSRRSHESSEAEEKKSPTEPAGKLDDNQSEKESIHSQPREKTPTPTPPSSASVSPQNVPASRPPPPPAPAPAPAPTSVPKATPAPLSQQSVAPQETIIPQSSMRDIAPLIRDRPRRPFPVNPNSTLVGFPHPSHFQPPSRIRPSLSRRFPPPPTRKNIISTSNIDYPIEDVYIDETIPYSMALKINETVERDRFNQTHPSQRISMGNNPSGLRFIREVKRPKKQVCYEIPEYDYYPGPIHHFIAFASPNDPMRCSY